MPLPCFKAYDLRGKVPSELNPDIAYRLGQAYAQKFQPRRVALGRDVRRSSRGLQEALALGLNHCGVETLDLGLCGTEEVYFAAFQEGIDGGIMVTASHNPMGENGMKLVRAGAVPVSGDSGLRELEAMVAQNTQQPRGRAALVPCDLRPAYVRHLLGYLRSSVLRPLKVVVNAGNGSAGPVIDALEAYLPLRFVKIHHRPDGDFPHGIPNPLLPENRVATAQAVVEHRADFGVAWDGDFDRCFLFDERGEFIEGYYIVGLLAEAMLRRHPGARIIHDPRLTWNTIQIVRARGGVPVQCKTGHAFIKERMRAEDAVYGGEMSAHHYFREFGYCDSGMLPWLLVAQLMCERSQPLSALVGESQRRFPASGEINRTVCDIAATLERVEEDYIHEADVVDHTDGLSMEFPDWRFNLRGSNTEPVLRLNVESRGDRALMQAKTRELLGLIEAAA
jgi:phosphomannomutase